MIGQISFQCHQVRRYVVDVGVGIFREKIGVRFERIVDFDTWRIAIAHTCSHDDVDSSLRGFIPGQPRRRTFFPLVVGQLLHVCTVVTHQENLAIGLWAVRVQCFIFEAHPG